MDDKICLLCGQESQRVGPCNACMDLMTREQDAHKKHHNKFCQGKPSLARQARIEIRQEQLRELLDD